MIINGLLYICCHVFMLFDICFISPNIICLPAMQRNSLYISIVQKYCPLSIFYWFYLSKLLSGDHFICISYCLETILSCHRCNIDSTAFCIRNLQHERITIFKKSTAFFKLKGFCKIKLTQNQRSEMLW